MKHIFLSIALLFPLIVNAETYFYVITSEKYDASDEFNQIQSKSIVLFSCYNFTTRRSHCEQEVITNNLAIWVTNTTSKKICEIYNLSEGKIVFSKNFRDENDPKNTSTGKYICGFTAKNMGASR